MNFLPEQKTKEPYALDEIFTEMHTAYQQRKVPMSEQQTSVSIGVITASQANIDIAYDGLSKEHWMFAGFFKRCEMFPIKFEKRLLLWLALTTAEFNIGGMILVGYYVQWWAYRYTDKGGILTLDAVMSSCFADGLFDKKTVHEFWDKQKINARPDNLIDHPGAALSFMPIERTEPINSNDHIF